MAFVNIRRDVDDKFYRYRMPLLQIKVEGKGNGIKTVVPNMSDIAKALSRPPSYPTKFFGFELGAQTTLDDKNDRYIINGSHSADRLRELLDSFIEKFVLCQSCKNPETDLKITKADGMILRDCKACGKRSNVDMRHKLTTFITKNPPPKKSKKGQGVDASEAENNGINGSENNTNGKDDGDAGSDDELTKKIQEEAKDIPTAEQRNNDDEDWSVDTSEAAVAARIQALEGGLKGSLTLNDDENEDGGEDEDSPYSLFGKWCKESKSGGESVMNDGQGPTPAEVYKKAQEFGIEKKHKTLLVLMQNLFTENVVKEIERFAPVLSKMNTSEKHQKSLLGGVERLCGVEIPTLIPTGVPKILMALYQIDVLDEEMIKTWSTHVSKKYVDKETCKKVRKASVPFVEWLDQAESSDEEDEDEDLDNL